MAGAGWPVLLDGWPWFRSVGSYPIPAYSEFMPPPRSVRKPYGEPNPPSLDPADPHGWPVTEYEEGLELRPGLHQVARPLLRTLVGLAAGDPGESVAALARGSPAWPSDLAEAGELAHERYVLLLPLALSPTQCEDGHVRWTLFGHSEQGAARPFWRGFFSAPGHPTHEAEATGFFSRLLHRVYAEPADELPTGLRILPTGEAEDGPLPAWVDSLRWEPGQSLRGVRYLLTFRPFARLPSAVRRAYLAADLCLLPCPGSLVFGRQPDYAGLQQRGLPLAAQIPMLFAVPRHDANGGLRVPEAGWTEEPRSGEPADKAATRRPRWPHRGPAPAGWAVARENRLAHALFGTGPDDISLYQKPAARNAQLWTAGFRPLLDGPRAGRDDLRRAAAAFAAGGRFGYRFQYPAAQVGRYSLFWHRPLVAYRLPSGPAAVLDDAPAGYLTAYPADRPDPTAPVCELWPRFLARDGHAEAVRVLNKVSDDEPGRTLQNVRNLLDTRDRLGWDRLPAAFARGLISAPERQTLDGWLGGLPARATDPAGGRRVAEAIRRAIDPPDTTPGKPEDSLTFRRTARRSFESDYWRTIAWLSGGTFPNRNAADPALDPATRAARGVPPRDLDRLAEALLARHRAAIAAAGMTGRAFAGELPFRWETEFEYPWMGGWVANQAGLRERNVLVVIPGRDRSRAVVLADHYDTAYQKDRYDPYFGGEKVRVAAPGADDNGSATAALLLAAPVLLELSRDARLGCDVWLLHLTGEEFPAEGTGARQFVRALVEGTLSAHTPGGDVDLSGVRVQGVYVLDMLAHDRRGRGVFQVSPGAGPTALWLAYQAHRAAEVWNAGAAGWNRRTGRRSGGRGRRSSDPGRVPAAAPFPRLVAEVRPDGDPHSTFYNADGQEFSDAGVPAVLLMEDYDIARTGYHDSKDTVALIDLGYGAALAAVAIEAAARAATESPPPDPRVLPGPARRTSPGR